MNVDSNPALFQRYVKIYLLYSEKASFNNCGFEKMLGLFSENKTGCSIISMLGMYLSKISLLLGI